MGYDDSSYSLRFDGVDYNTVTTGQLLDKMERKIKALTEKRAERGERIEKLKKEYGITDARLASMLLQQAAHDRRSSGMKSYESEDGTVVPAGVVHNLLQERKMIDEEDKQARKLNLILRNIDRTHGERQHRLNDDEMTYLGF